MTLNRQGILQQWPESPTVTPPKVHPLYPWCSLDTLYLLACQVDFLLSNLYTLYLLARRVEYLLRSLDTLYLLACQVDYLLCSLYTLYLLACRVDYLFAQLIYPVFTGMPSGLSFVQFRYPVFTGMPGGLPFAQLIYPVFTGMPGGLPFCAVDIPCIYWHAGWTTFLRSLYTLYLLACQAELPEASHVSVVASLDCWVLLTPFVCWLYGFMPAWEHCRQLTRVVSSSFGWLTGLRTSSN